MRTTRHSGLEPESSDDACMHFRVDSERSDNPP
ncbi:hypothetical protein HNQ50_000539 [Silvimonas terrae]|uniref:Uncharacterized protein n=1 Tax=Silvimonas terrae TaxID=300266 RepID=A0A840R8Z2_9NEIS|nr:hypothetical protein [Silvimonas terrae]